MEEREVRIRERGKSGRKVKRGRLGE